jgi:hypothetical protein
MDLRLFLWSIVDLLYDNPVRSGTPRVLLEVYIAYVYLFLAQLLPIKVEHLFRNRAKWEQTDMASFVIHSFIHLYEREDKRKSIDMLRI